MPTLGQPVAIGDQFYNVGEEYTMYDTVVIVGNLDQLSTQPPGWYQTFALAGNAQHWFFNVRNRGNCEEPYCNLDARDQTSYAFQADSISCSFWGSGFNSPQLWDAPDPVVDYTRLWKVNAFWQAYLPFESSLTLRIQQDDKTKLNTMMATPGYGPVGGGFGNIGASTQANTVVPNLTCQTQGIAKPQARIKFPTVVNIPRRASINVEVNFTPYARDFISGMPGPGTVPYFNVGYTGTLQAYVMYGITVALHGRRLVQQRGALHA